jgi:hypothetical protein
MNIILDKTISIMLFYKSISRKMSSREEDLDDLSSTNNEEASLSGGDRLLLDK